MFQTYKRGFALPSALFLMVFLAMLGISILAINNYNQKSTIADMLETKAFLAAKLGVEYGSYQAIKNGICLGASQTVNITDSYFIGFKTSYTCQSRTSDEAGISSTYYTITSFGCNTTGASCPDGIGRPSTEEYVEKSITVIVSN